MTFIKNLFTGLEPVMLRAIITSAATIAAGAGITIGSGMQDAILGLILGIIALVNLGMGWQARQAVYPIAKVTGSAVAEEKPVEPPSVEVAGEGRG